MDRKQWIGSLVLVLNAILLIVAISINYSSLDNPARLSISAMGMLVFAIVAFMGSLFVMNEKAKTGNYALGMILIILIPALFMFYVPAGIVVSSLVYGIVNIILTVIGIYFLKK